nr:MAG: ParB-like nuclease domain [Bacteriophage sp.]
MAAMIIETKIENLVPDDLNANKGTEYGQHLIENSLRKFGAGRSILIDRNNRIIAGNKTIENAANIGLDNVIVVETDGNQIVAVKRKDIDLDSEKGREMALADNATSDANLQWDENAIENITARWNDINPEDWGIDLAQPEEEEEKEDVKKELSTKLVVQCTNVSQLSLLYSELQDRGFICELKE